uniref:Uncharacterized protein n=1 Tax=Arundo donax TaxID=35708 RepID=A0A0A9FNG1_ARUDO
MNHCKQLWHAHCSALGCSNCEIQVQYAFNSRHSEFKFLSLETGHEITQYEMCLEL